MFCLIPLVPLSWGSFLLAVKHCCVSFCFWESLIAWLNRLSVYCHLSTISRGCGRGVGCGLRIWQTVSRSLPLMPSFLPPFYLDHASSCPCWYIAGWEDIIDSANGFLDAGSSSSQFVSFRKELNRWLLLAVFWDSWFPLSFWSHLLSTCFVTHIVQGLRRDDGCHDEWTAESVTSVCFQKGWRVGMRRGWWWWGKIIWVGKGKG